MSAKLRGFDLSADAALAQRRPDLLDALKLRADAAERVQEIDALAEQCRDALVRASGTGGRTRGGSGRCDHADSTGVESAATMDALRQATVAMAEVSTAVHRARGGLQAAERVAVKHADPEEAKQAAALEIEQVERAGAGTFAEPVGSSSCRQPSSWPSCCPSGSSAFATPSPLSWGYCSRSLSYRPRRSCSGVGTLLRRVRTDGVEAARIRGEMSTLDHLAEAEASRQRLHDAHRGVLEAERALLEVQLEWRAALGTNEVLGLGDLVAELDRLEHDSVRQAESVDLAGRARDLCEQLRAALARDRSRRGI